jgi:phosphoenolpyruvate carboxykinase (ATP)
MDALKTVSEAVKALHKQKNVCSLHPRDLRVMAEKFGLKTEFGNYNFASSVKNRSSGVTVYVGSEKVRQKELNENQKKILANLDKTLADVHTYFKKTRFVCVERKMGSNPHFTPRCKLFVSVYKKYSLRLAYMVCETLFDLREGHTGKLAPEFNVIYIPEWQEKDRQIIVFPEIGVTYVLGSDYYGEAKKGFLRLAMWHAKQNGMLGLHAGAKILKAKVPGGKIKKYGMIIFGLTATGKTTHTCHDHGLTEKGEGIGIVQDDVTFLKKDGSVLGSEKGFYVKTEGLNPKTQPLLYHATTRSDAILENVMVDYNGRVDFNDQTLTGNGRAIIQSKDLGKYMGDVNTESLKSLDGLIMAFITRRNTVSPIVAKLTAEQAAAFFMLGESVESSAGDPKRAGESVREVGTNPFIIGDYTEEGNWIYDFICANKDKVQCYLLNTGGVGEIMEKDKAGNKILKQKVTRVEIPEMAAIIRSIAKGSIDWTKDQHFGLLVPKAVSGVDMHRFDLNKFYTKDQIISLVSQLKKERKEWLARFKGLKKEIVNGLG